MPSPLDREILLAEYVARGAHAGQTDKHGEPYILHPERVAARVTRTLKPAAWLHDVVEDTRLTLDDLKTLGFSTVTVGLVETMTRVDEFYNDYIRRLLRTGTLGANLLKLADVVDNMRPPIPGDLETRYNATLELIQADLLKKHDVRFNSRNEMTLLVRLPDDFKPRPA